MNKFGEDESNVAELRRLGGVATILAAMQRHYNDASVMMMGAAALSHITGVGEVMAAMSDIKRCQGEGVSVAELENSLNNIACLASVAANRGLLFASELTHHRTYSRITVSSISYYCIIDPPGGFYLT